ncbi:MAG: dephospho-CoA kinase, partial [Lachnospiraceae bacterium]|nr:dephospho-CoA kinase [Lachnospiraceae bacterium]
HPAVKDEVRERTAKAKEEGKVGFVFIEAALLIEAGYLPELDELWYVCAGEKLRAKRLKEARGYTEERIEGIMEQQLTEEEFRKYAHRVIVNDGTIEELKEQIDNIMGDYLWQE